MTLDVLAFGSNPDLGDTHSQTTPSIATHKLAVVLCLFRSSMLIMPDISSGDFEVEASSTGSGSVSGGSIVRDGRSRTPAAKIEPHWSHQSSLGTTTTCYSLRLPPMICEGIQKEIQACQVERRYDTLPILLLAALYSRHYSGLMSRYGHVCCGR